MERYLVVATRREISDFGSGLLPRILENFLLITEYSANSDFRTLDQPVIPVDDEAEGSGSD